MERRDFVRNALALPAVLALPTMPKMESAITKKPDTLEASMLTLKELFEKTMHYKRPQQAYSKAWTLGCPGQALSLPANIPISNLFSPLSVSIFNEPMNGFVLRVGTAFTLQVKDQRNNSCIQKYGDFSKVINLQPVITRLVNELTDNLCKVLDQVNGRGSSLMLLDHGPIVELDRDILVMEDIISSVYHFGIIIPCSERFGWESLPVLSERMALTTPQPNVVTVI